MTPEHSVTIDGHDYPILFTIGSMSRLQRESGLRLGDFLRVFTTQAELAQLVEAGQFEQAGLRVITGIGLLELQGLLFAGLEGARAKIGHRTKPYTWDEVGDLMESHQEGLILIFAPLVRAFLAFISRFTGASSAAGGGSEKNGPTVESISTTPKSGRGSTAKARKPA